MCSEVRKARREANELASADLQLCDRTGICASSGELEFPSVNKTKKLNRGVAKLASRQFRVLEIVGSNPATSTKTVSNGLLFFMVEVSELSPKGSPTARKYSR